LLLQQQDTHFFNPKLKRMNHLQPFLHKRSGSGIFKALIVLIAAVSLHVTANASHFRYGNISWSPLSGNTIQFKISQAWRISFFFGGTPSVGATVTTSSLNFGDGTSVPVTLTITSVNPVEDWFFGSFTVNHTYAGTGNYTAWWFDCCRISSLVNNPDGNYRVQTTVNVGSGNSSPVSSLTPIINLPVNNAAASFAIPVLDPNGNPLSFRLATAAEAAGGFYNHPAGLSVNSSTGVVSFSTVGKTVGQLYTTQIIIQDGTSSIALDFIIKIVQAVNNTPPVFDYGVTPANGHVFTVNAGTPLSFTVKANDADAGDNVNLSAAGVPVGPTFTPALPASGNPVNSVFNWTPSVADIGNYIVNFQAQDNVGASALTSVTIKVVSTCNLVLNTSVTNVNCFGENTGAIDLTVSNATGSVTYEWSNGAITEDISNLTAGTYSVTATDANGCKQTTSVLVNQPAAALAASMSASGNYNGYDVSCNGAADGSLLVKAAGGTAAYQYTLQKPGGTETNASGIFTGLAAGTYSCTVTDANGCTVTTNSVTLSAPPALTCAIGVSPVYTVTGQAAHTIYLGYGPQSVTLTASGNGGTGNYQYNWGANGTGASISVSPKTTTVYTVTTQDANGCTSTCQMTIYVINVICNINNGKVTVCHKAADQSTIELCVAADAVAAHLLEHGDLLGHCNTTSARQITGTTTEQTSPSVETGLLKIYPNPAGKQLNITWNSTSSERVIFQISDAQGRLLHTYNTSAANGMVTKQLPLNNLKKGIYFLNMRSGSMSKTTMFMVR
jgi:hypothetical protein